MPVGASKGFSVWTKANQVWQSHLLQFIKEREFVTAEEIYLESIKINPKSNCKRAFGIWGTLRPDKHQIYNFLKCKATWIKESDKKLYPECERNRPPKGKTILWELVEDWPIKYGEYSHDMMMRADMLRQQGTVKYT